MNVKLSVNIVVIVDVQRKCLKKIAWRHCRIRSSILELPTSKERFNYWPRNYGGKVLPRDLPIFSPFGVPKIKDKNRVGSSVSLKNVHQFRSGILVS